MRMSLSTKAVLVAFIFAIWGASLVIWLGAL